MLFSSVRAEKLKWRRSFSRCRIERNKHHEIGANGRHWPREFSLPRKCSAFSLQDALHLLPGNDIKVLAHVQPRQTTAEMAAGLKKILADEKPALVVWQAGTFDAVSGIDPDDFRTSLAEGVDAINTAGADADLMNMQYSPRTETMLGVAPYADIMHLVAQEHGVPLFDRLAIMRFWNDQGTFDLYAATKEYDMARKVHDCIGRALASQIVSAAHLTP